MNQNYDDNDPIMNDSYCVTAACQNRAIGPRRALHGLLVCSRCADHLRDALVEIPDLWRDLDDPELLFPQKSEPIRKAPGQAPGTPANLTYIVLRDKRSVWREHGDLIHPVAALAGYRDLVLDHVAGRNIEITDARQPWYQATGSSLAEICRALSVYADTTLRQPWIEYLHWTIILIRDQLRSLTGTRKTTYPVGYCPETITVHGNTKTCTMPLWYPHTGDLECARCGTIWPRRNWIAFNDQQQVA